jgi:hypothetical protein
MKQDTGQRRHEAGRMKYGARHIAAVISILALLASCILPLAVEAQEPDPYEPDELEPPWIANDELQERSFYPEGDVDYARFRVKAGHWYEVHTQDLGPLVDTILNIQVAGINLEDDDGGSEPLASRLTFRATETTEALITIINSHGAYGPTQTYKLYAGEIPAPTPTRMPTPEPTATPKPTRTPAPTSTPARPIVSFSASPDRVEKPGDCVTLRWSVERVTEVFLVYPNGSRQGVIGHDEREVCPLETVIYTLEVHAPGGDEMVEVQVRVPLPTHTPTPVSGGGGSVSSGKGTVHAVVFVDENRSQAYDPREGILGAAVTLMSQTDPGQVWVDTTDILGQVHFPKVPAGSYTLLIPHLGYAELVPFRGDDLTMDVLVAPIRLPSRIP